LHRTKELHIFTIMCFVALQLPFFCIFLQKFMIMLIVYQINPNRNNILFSITVRSPWLGLRPLTEAQGFHYLFPIYIYIKGVFSWRVKYNRVVTFQYLKMGRSIPCLARRTELLNFLFA
jgi:hypothetical protein